MAKQEPQEGNKVRLILAKEGREVLSEEEYKVVKVLDNKAIKVEDKRGETLNALKARVRVVQGSEIGDQRIAEKEEERKMTTATEVKEKKAETKKAKKVKAPAALVPFDVNGWAKEHGGILLSKKCDFDHKSHELWAHVAVDAEKGFYHTINAYKYPDGTVSRGKNDSGGDKYPLKGHRLTKQVKVKKTGKVESKPSVGKETAAQYVARCVKKGYKLVMGKPPEDPEAEKKPAKKAKAEKKPDAKPAEAKATEKTPEAKPVEAAKS